MIKKYKVKCNLFWDQINYYENDEIEIEEAIAEKYPHFFESKEDEKLESVKAENQNTLITRKIKRNKK